MTNANPVTAISKEVAKFHEIKRLLDGEELNEAELLTVLEGETNLAELLLKLEEEIAEKDSMAEAVGLRIKELQGRKSRIEASAETLRQIIHTAMVRAEIDKIPGPLATLTVKKTPPKLEIKEESEIPAQYWTPQDPKLDKKAVTDALKAGEIVPGAAMGPGGTTLQIRRG